MKLLIIEEEKGESRSLVHDLRRDGYRCEVWLVGSSDLHPIHFTGFDCVLLHSIYADRGGLAIIRSLRKAGYDGGIVLLSGSASSDAVIAGLNAGADACLSLPFHRGELNARIVSLVRRRYFSGNPVIMRNELSIDLSGKTAFVHQKPLELTRKEFDLLLYLASHNNKIISKEAIATNLTDQQEVHSDMEFVYAHIKNLKRKLAAAGSRDHITSVYGMGYKFVL